MALAARAVAPQGDEPRVYLAVAVKVPARVSGGGRLAEGIPVRGLEAGKPVHSGRGEAEGGRLSVGLQYADALDAYDLAVVEDGPVIVRAVPLPHQLAGRAREELGSELGLLGRPQYHLVLDVEAYIDEYGGNGHHEDHYRDDDVIESGPYRDHRRYATAPRLLAGLGLGAALLELEDPVIHEQVHEDRVELRARHPLHLFQYGSEGQGPPVGGGAPPGGEDVRYRDYPGLERYLLALQSARIARAVVVLVVGAYYPRARLHERYALEYLLPDLGVFLYVAAFRLCKGAFLVEYALAGAELAEVMEERRVLEGLSPLGREPRA